MTKIEQIKRHLEMALEAAVTVRRSLTTHWDFEAWVDTSELEPNRSKLTKELIKETMGSADGYIVFFLNPTDRWDEQLANSVSM